MNSKQIISLVLLAAGILLIVLSVQRMDTFHESVKMKISGTYSKETMWLLISGILMLILGSSGAVIFRGAGRRRD